MIRLTLHLKNGRSVSGVYIWPEALRVLRFAALQDAYSDFTMEGV